MFGSPVARLQLNSGNNPAGYRPELDVVRFSGFAMVFVHHLLASKLPAPLVTITSFGNDILFLLTGYLITSLLLRERDAIGSVDIKSFYIRRALRLWPLYFLCIIIIATLDDWERPDQQLRPFHLAGLFLFAGNWVMAYAPVSFLAAPLWSISVSEQFYLVWPWVVRRAKTNVMFLACCGAIVAAVLCRWWMLALGADGPTMHFITIARLDPFAIGAAIAIFYRGVAPAFRASARILLGGSSALIGILVIRAIEASAHPPYKTGAWYPLVILCFSGTFLSVLGCMPEGRPHTPSARLFAYLGKLSFGMFLWHTIVASLLGHAGVPRFLEANLAGLHSHEFWIPFTWVVTLFTATFATANVSYFAIEKPFLVLKPQRRGRRSDLPISASVPERKAAVAAR